jgi:xanthine dehydrogenase accessory factor
MLASIDPTVLLDARMRKQKPETGIAAAPLVVGLGPGFTAGENCHAVVETMRGHNLGRVFWEGAALPDTGVPGSIAKYGLDRVLRAPAEGLLQTHTEIGASLKSGHLIAVVDGREARAPFDGVVRGLLPDGFLVHKGLKIGDLDPRNDPSYCWLVSDKALAIGGGVLEAVLSKPEIRAKLCS